MHQPVREGLEDYLSGKRTQTGALEAHLSVCAQCAAEIGELQQQTRLIRTLRAEAAEPAPGFYARVLERIEQRVKPSVWSILLEPAIGRRIAVASATLALVLGGYLLNSERVYHSHAPAAIAAGATQSAAIVQDSDASPQDRDAVLVNLASFRDN